jgi:hypothetical protein
VKKFRIRLRPKLVIKPVYVHLFASPVSNESRVVDYRVDRPLVDERLVRESVYGRVSYFSYQLLPRHTYLERSWTIPRMSLHDSFESVLGVNFEEIRITGTSVDWPLEWKGLVRDGDRRRDDVR